MKKKLFMNQCDWWLQCHTDIVRLLQLQMTGMSMSGVDEMSLWFGRITWLSDGRTALGQVIADRYKCEANSLMTDLQVGVEHHLS